MSSRVLRKLHGEKDIVSIPTEEICEPEEVDISSGARRKQLKINRDDLLNSQSQSESEVKEGDDNDALSSQILNCSKDSRESTRRKKKKKKMRPCESSHYQSSEDVDEVERSVREVNAILGDVIEPRPAASGDNVMCRTKGILAIEHKHLNAKNELKRIFGSKVTQAENSKRRNRGRSHIKNFWLVTPEEHWPNIGKPGVSMRFLENKDGLHYFTFEHSTSYQSIQRKFLGAVESFNPDNIIAIVNDHPYNINTLIQLSDLCKLNEDLAMATELIERALYCLESAFHPLFNITNGNCRLNYRRQENRGFYITLFKHLTFIGQKVCYRTALEFCKLILSLEPEGDPLGIVLAIDFYAIRAGEYSWLLQFFEELNPVRNLSQLPNFSFSIALAHFYLQNDVADELLQDALLMFPGVLLPLLDKYGVQLDPRARSHHYFNNAQTSQEASLKQYVLLYVCRSYHIWRDKDLLPWLEKNTQIVMDRVDNRNPIVKDYANKRSRRYLGKLPRCVERHIFLSDLKEVMPAFTEQNADSTFSFDPLPPVDSINLYTRPQSRGRYDNLPVLCLFISSLMPSFNVNYPTDREEPDIDIPPEEDNARALVVGDLHRGVLNLLDSMRGLMLSIHHPEDANAEQDAVTDNENTDNDAQ